MSWWILVTQAYGATISVDASGGSDYTLIQKAIDAASSGDTITVAAGSYDEELDAKGKDLTLTGVGSGSVEVSGDGVGLSAEDGETITLSGMTFSGAQQGIAASGARLTLDDVIIEDNDLEGNGAGMLLYDGSTVTISDCVITNNSSSGSYNGGGIYVSESTLSLEDCEVSDNTARQGAGIYLTDSTLTLTDVTISDNVAATHGGGLRVRAASSLTATRTIVRDNSASSRGGAASVENSDTTWTDATIEGNSSGTGGGAMHLSGMGSSGTTIVGELSNNTAAGAGGALFASDHDLVVSGSMESNVAAEGEHGGAIYVSSGELTLRDLELVDHHAQDGGAVYLGSGHSLTIEDVSISGSSAQGSGGAIYSLSAVTASGLTVEDNEASDSGGAVYVRESDTSCEDCTFSRNTADAGAGGGWGQVGGEFEFDECRFEDNVAVTGGGLYHQGDGSERPRLSDSVLIGNSATTEGGGAAFIDATSVRSLSNYFGDNEGLSGGGLYASDAPLVARQNLVFNNTAEVGGGISAEGMRSGRIEHSDIGGNTAERGSGVAVLSPIGAYKIYNSRIYENESTEGGGALFVFGDDSGVQITNIDVSANTGGGIYLESSPDTVVINAIVFSNGTAGFIADSESASAPISYCDVFGHDTDWLGDFETGEGVDGHISQDPSYVALVEDGDPTIDVLSLLTDSPCRDAGDPGILDPDGSISDMGSYGGTDADFDDSDGDGYTANEGDCDDEDETVNPGADETWYDGVDSDCDGGNDYDQDGDGYTSDAFGGTDCGDADASVYPGADDPEGDGIDQDCDGTDGSGGGGGDDGGSDDGGSDDGGGSGYDGRDEDQDNDGYTADEDCDDTEPLSYPGNTELCGDDIDNDCDGSADAFDDDCMAKTSDSCGGCATAAPLRGLWLLLPGLVLMGRRRR